QTVRRLKRERPDTRIIVTGCAAQIQPAMYTGMAEVDRIIGNDDKLRGDAWRAARDALEAGDGGKIAVADFMTVRAMAPPRAATGRPRLPRAFVQVQNGCDHRCTFCVIPYGRGNSRSLPEAAVIEEARRLVAAGHVEIVLTGVDL